MDPKINEAFEILDKLFDLFNNKCKIILTRRYINFIPLSQCGFCNKDFNWYFDEELRLNMKTYGEDYYEQTKECAINAIKLYESLILACNSIIKLIECNDQYSSDVKNEEIKKELISIQDYNKRIVIISCIVNCLENASIKFKKEQLIIEEPIEEFFDDLTSIKERDFERTVYGRKKDERRRKIKKLSKRMDFCKKTFIKDKCVSRQRRHNTICENQLYVICDSKTFI